MNRLIGAWRELGREQRLAALTALGLFASMLLPWYSKTVVESAKAGQARLPTSQASLSAFQAFSFVEAAVLLVSAGVLAMLFARAEGRDFQLPGGDGTIVMIAGGWAALLIFYRLLDKPSLQGTQRITATVGVEWGIFIALLLALGLLYTGGRIRAGERGQPPLSRSRQRARERARERDPEREETIVRFTDDDDRRGSHSAADERARPAAGGPVPARPGAARAAEAPRSAPRERRPPRGRPRYPPAPSAPSEQMSFEDAPPREE
jgi:hypothetical protein